MNTAAPEVNPAAPEVNPAAPEVNPAAPEHRSGFAALVGRPNAGKSTLINRLVGRKIAITSPKPQTTRRTVRGILTRPDGQLIIVDTPGLHRPRTLLGERLNDLVRSHWTEVDVIGLCLAADERSGPGDRYLATALAGVPQTPVVVIVTKTDLVNSDLVARRLASASQLADDVNLKVADFVPVSAVTGAQVDVVTDVLMSRLPLGPQLFDPAIITDESEEMMIAELIREAALHDVDDELPHSIAVSVDELGMREGRGENRPLMDIHATIHVERESQKPIIIGKGGSRLKVIGSNARGGIEALIGVPVYLDLHVRVAKDWQRDARQLRKLGF